MPRSGNKTRFLPNLCGRKYLILCFSLHVNTVLISASFLGVFIFWCFLDKWWVCKPSVMQETVILSSTHTVWYFFPFLQNICLLEEWMAQGISDGEVEAFTLVQS